MIDYRHFTQQAEKDLMRAEKSFEDEDYGFAAFCAQQGLEKYLKAYFLKFRIFTDPQRLGHLQLPVILDELADIFERGIPCGNLDKPLKKLMPPLVKWLKGMSEFLDGINKSEQKKILVWKQSLGIMLTGKEQKLYENLSKKIDLDLNKLQIPLKQYWKKNPIEIDVENKDIDPKYKLAIEKLALLRQKMMRLVETTNYSNNRDLEQIRDELSILLGMFYYGKGNELFTIEETDFFIKIIKLWRCADWFDTILSSYSHEQISRYPTLIDDQDSITWYKLQKENLLKLINEIRETCDSIKSEIGI